MNRWLRHSLWTFLTFSLAGCGNMAGQAPPTPAASDANAGASTGTADADPAAKNTIDATPVLKTRPGSAIAEEDLGSLSPNGDTTVETVDEPAAP